MTKTRRRGAELESAIYQATRDILAQDGFTKLTFSEVAKLAGTSKPVIYRRWSSPLELALVAIQDKIKSDNNGQLDELQMTGHNLSEDLFQIMSRFTVSIDTFNQAFVITWLHNLNDTDSEQVKKLLDSVKRIDAHVIDRAVQRAQKRGELAMGDLPMDIKLMPFDWLRYRIYSNEPIDKSVLELLVDNLLIPSYQHILPAIAN